MQSFSHVFEQEELLWVPPYQYQKWQCTSGAEKVISYYKMYFESLLGTFEGVVNDWSPVSCKTVNNCLIYSSLRMLLG